MRKVRQAQKVKKALAEVPTSAERLQGTVVRLFTDRGFGFISEDPPEGDGEPPQDRFFHVKALKGGDKVFRGLVLGQRVEFTPHWDTLKDEPTALLVEVVG